MRNLIAFLRRFRVFLVFVAFQAICLTIYFTYLNFPRSQYLTSASYVNGKLLSARNSVTHYLYLSENNKKLQVENIRLRSRMPLSYVRMNNNQVRINDTLFDQQYEYIAATVIHSTTSRMNNYFTLNIGSAQGIKRGMGVFSDDGVVGTIHSVSEHFATVKSVLTENINIDVMIENSGAFGLLKWDGRNPRLGNIEGISNDIPVKKWSRVITRGGSGIFPRGLTVGKVANVESEEARPLWRIQILFGEDYRKIQRVYVVRNLLQEEQEKLEETIPADK